MPEPKPKPTDILVRIKAIALNRADLGSAKGDTSSPIVQAYGPDVVIPLQLLDRAGNIRDLGDG